MNVTEQLNTSVSTRVQAAMTSVLAQVVYGSHLYGTNTETSDHDYKIIYLPSLDQVLLGEKFTNFKARFDAEGNPVGDNEAMPADGFEAEFIALQTYMRDFLEGQTYAVEVAFAIKNGFAVTITQDFVDLNEDLIEDFQTNSVAAMVGFATKQTFDYVHRGERLREAQFFYDLLREVCDEMGNPDPRTVRLDSPFSEYARKSVYDYMEFRIAECGMTKVIQSTVTLNVNRNQRSFTFGGRQYLETTPIAELQAIIKKRIDSYGNRSTAAAESNVDPKSLMHAIRVYEQSIELLQSGFISFPRENAEELLNVRNQTFTAETVKERLSYLDTTVQALREAYPSTVDEKREEFREWTIDVLKYFYDIDDAVVKAVDLDEEELEFVEGNDLVDDVADTIKGVVTEARQTFAEMKTQILTAPATKKLTAKLKNLVQALKDE